MSLVGSSQEMYSNLPNVERWSFLQQNVPTIITDHHASLANIDPLMHYLSIPYQIGSNGVFAAMTIWNYYTDHQAFIQQHFSKEIQETPKWNILSSQLNGVVYQDPLLTWCVRYDHLWLIECLLNSPYQQMVNWNILELFHGQSILHILAQNANKSIWRYLALIRKLIIETDISVMHRTSNGDRFVHLLTVPEDAALKFKFILDELNIIHAKKLIYEIGLRQYNIRQAVILLNKISGINGIYGDTQCTIMHVAVDNGKIALIEKILERYDYDISTVDGLGNNVLHAAILSKLQSRRKVAVIDTLFSHHRTHELMHQRNTQVCVICFSFVFVCAI